MARELHLLIIEDSEDDTFLLVHELRKGGFEPVFTQVKTVQELETALDSPDWDAITSDYNLQNLTGLEALRGIPEEIMGKIFAPYVTTKEDRGGTGVGLFMSKTIIEKNMGGRLSACNLAGGAEFTIEV